MKRVIITGATGAIGIALINEFICDGVEVLVLCREGSLRNNRIPTHPLIEKKYCALEQLSFLQNDAGKTYEVFYHLAWEGTTGKARNDMFLQNRNVIYSLNAVGVAKRFGCHTFVGTGSQAEYGRVEGLLKPDTPTFPETGYGIGKLCAGQMTREYAQQLGMKHIWVRILSVYGPYDGEQSMVMSTINKLKSGITLQFTKGEQMWDYLYSSDAAKALELIGNKGIDGKVYVLGSGKARPLWEYIKNIRDVVNAAVDIDLGAIPYNDKQVMYLCADISSLMGDTEWRPETDFEKGIKLIVKAQML